MNICFVLWAIIQYYLIHLVAQMKFQLEPLRMRPWLLSPFDIPYRSSFQSHVLPFWYYKMLHFLPWSYNCACVGASVLSDFVQPYGLQPTRLFCPWDILDKNTGVGCHFRDLPSNNTIWAELRE